MARKTQRGVPRELERAGALCMAFANTAAPRPDDRRKDSKARPATPLSTYGEIVAWAQRMGVLGAAGGERLSRLAAERPEKAAAVVAQAHELCAALLRTFTTVASRKEPRSSDLEILNRTLRVRSVFREGDRFSRGWGETESLERVLWPIAQSAAELLTSEDHRKIRQCATRGCFRLFVYANNRRRWCDDNTCGSRSRGRRHHQRLRELGERLEEMKPAERRRYLEQGYKEQEARAARKKEALDSIKRMREQEARSRAATEPGPVEAGPKPEEP